MMAWFGKKKIPHAWAGFTDEQQKLCRAAERTSWQKDKHGIAAVNQNWPDVAAVIFDTCNFHSDKVNILRHIVKNAKAASLPVLAAKAARVESYARVELLQHAVAKGWLEGIELVLSAMTKDDVADVIKGLATKHAHGDSHTQACFDLLFKANPQRMQTYLEYCSKKRPVLWSKVSFEAPLARTSRIGRGVLAYNLLGAKSKKYHRYGAEIVQKYDVCVDAGDGRLMRQVLKNGDMALAQLLAERGFNFDRYGEAVLRDLYECDAGQAAIDFMTSRVNRQAFAAVDAGNKGYALCGPDAVCLTQPLPDGGRLTYSFNFALRQQVVIAAGGDTPVPPAVVPFAQLDDGWQAAADAYVALGGDAKNIAGLQQGTAVKTLRLGGKS